MRKNFLKAVSSTYPNTTVEEAKELCRELFGADDITLVYPDNDRQVKRTAKLANVLRQRKVELRATYTPTDEVDDSEIETQEVEEGEENEIDTARGAATESEMASRAANNSPIVERVIRELDRQERRRDFMWAGFVVKDLLPGQGMDKWEAQSLFDDMRNEGLLLLTKSRSPKNPEFASTCVRLNREHPTVRRVLGSESRSKDFKPIPIRGEPASVTLIRDRR